MSNLSKSIVALAFLLAAGALWFTQKNTDSIAPTNQTPSGLTPPAAPGESLSPFTVAQEGVAASDPAALAQSHSQSDSAASQEGRPPLPAVDVTALGRNGISDEDFKALLIRLKNDPELLQQLIDEARQESDPVRLALLARLLGETGGESVLMLASELIFSGDTGSREQGLELLQMLQPGSEQARDIVAGMLTTEIEPQILVGTLTTLADPGDVDDQSRAYLSEQVAWLAEHEDSTVRSISLDILSRWTTDSQYTSVLLAGLDDESLSVRRSAAYALADHEDQSPEVIDQLLRVVHDSSESKGVRKAAILASRRMPISDAQRLSVQAVEKELNTVRR